ncbi:malectin domain-containing carbohydrate-binding protein [Deinococcus pimensis]|uniref:malectin domain-containing carbohydrate-binding protein n=1 Tax=Deinococcus pimensis TaxID=309888 RepID=UPI0004BAC623|nr:malectin domain-containing carbohydrate-binding protein [Deinococcus pimensis]
MLHTSPSPSRLRAALLLSLALVLGACGAPDPSSNQEGGGVVDQQLAAPTNFTASADPDGVTLDWADVPGDVSGYRVSRADSQNGPYALLTSEPVQTSTYRDTTAPAGKVSYYRVVTVGASGAASVPATTSVTRPAVSTSLARITVENRDAFPFQDRLVFSRIQEPVSGQNVHDTVTLRVRSTGQEALVITDVPVQGPWTITNLPALPATVNPGGSLDLTVKFTATGPGPTSRHLHEGNLTLRTNDSTRPALVVQLAGTWQQYSENNDEPSVEDIRRAFGYQFTYTKPGQNLNQWGAVVPTGDEVISAYWQRVDETKPVTVTQLAAFHNQSQTAALFWHPKGSSNRTSVLTHDASYGQSLLPRVNGGTGIARTTFTPSKVFGFNVDGVEWTDPALNGRSENCTPSATTQCGHDLRFWPVRDPSGQVIPDTYLMLMDYVGINYDYNDNMFLVSNVKPAPILYDVGARNGASYTDPQGRVWMPDLVTTYSSRVNQSEKRGIVVPDVAGTTAPDEPAQPTTVPIANSSIDPVYQTYRALMNPEPAQDRRIMHYTVPLNNGTYTVNLHFAELYWNAPGQRVFDVLAENAVVLPNLDIFAQAGKNTALVKPLQVTVTDGQLNIDLRATKDYGALAGLEILR